MTARTVGPVALAAILFAIAALISIHIITSLAIRPFSVSGLPNPTALDIEKLLAKVAPDGLPAGTVEEIAKLRKADGSELLFLIAEGTFKKSTIEPTATWSNLLSKPTLIVSSSDEMLSNDGGISLPIGIGCAIQQVTSPIPTGTVHIAPCNGNYRKAFPNIRYVGNAVVVAWKGVDETPNCKLDSAILVASQPDYVKCIQNAIESSLGDLFKKQEIRDVDTVILPAFGTGTGKIAKGIFYRAVSDALEKCLTSRNGCDRTLPHRIVFLVWSREWSVTKDAIGRNLVRLGDNWRMSYVPESPIAKQARYLGVLLVLLAFVLLLACRPKLPAAIAENLPKFQDASLWLVVLGWGFVAAGVFTVLSDVTDVFASRSGIDTKWNVIFNIGIGATAAVFCGLIHKATKAFQGD